MRRLKLKVLTLLVVACFSVAKGQLHEGPTIQLGLNGLNFDKGNFDAELVAEIIAEKQSELQSKLIKSMILNNVGTDNGLVYSYLFSLSDFLSTSTMSCYPQLIFIYSDVYMVSFWVNLIIMQFQQIVFGIDVSFYIG